MLAEVDEGDNATGHPIVTATRAYDVYGSVRPLESDDSASASKHKFCGGLGHTADSTGLTYMRARYYDPELGRFISEDPAGQGSNWYAYCSGDPVSYTDATGLVYGPDDVLVQEVTAASAAVGAGASCHPETGDCALPLGDTDHPSPRGWPGGCPAKICRSQRTGQATGVAITNGARQVFVDFFTHGKPHFDVQNSVSGWSKMWRDLYDALNGKEF